MQLRMFVNYLSYVYVQISQGNDSRHILVFLVKSILVSYHIIKHAQMSFCLGLNHFPGVLLVNKFTSNKT